MRAPAQLRTKADRVYEQLPWDPTDWWRRIFKTEPERMHVSLPAHEALYDAPAQADGDAGSASLRTQKRRARASLRTQKRRARASLLDHIREQVEQAPPHADVA